MSEEKVTVGFVLPNLIVGGAERVTLRIINSLDRSLFAPFLLVGSKRGDLVNSLPEGLQVFELGQERVSRVLPSLGRSLYTLKPQIVYSTLGMEIPVGLLARTFGFKSLYRLANTLTPFLDEVASRNGRLAEIFKASNRAAYDLNALGVCQADYMLEDAKRVLEVDGRKFRRIYNPIPAPSLATPVKRQKPYVLAIGNLHHRKGFDMLLSAWKHVERADFDLIIIGEGKERENLEEMIAQLELAERVLLIGHQDNVAPWIKGAEFVVSSSRYEGLSNAILEALAEGVPVIATDCPSGIREVLEHQKSGYLCTPSIDGLTGGLRAGLEDAKVWRTMSGEWAAPKLLSEENFSQSWNRLFGELA